MPLTMMQEMSIRDANGNCQCGYCGKYRKRSDFPEQQASVTVGNSDVVVHAHIAPACKFCMAAEHVEIED